MLRDLALSIKALPPDVVGACILIVCTVVISYILHPATQVEKKERISKRWVSRWHTVMAVVNAVMLCSLLLSCWGASIFALVIERSILPHTVNVMIALYCALKYITLLGESLLLRLTSLPLPPDHFTYLTGGAVFFTIGLVSGAPHLHWVMMIGLLMDGSTHLYAHAKADVYYSLPISDDEFKAIQERERERVQAEKKSEEVTEETCEVESEVESEVEGEVGDEEAMKRRLEKKGMKTRELAIHVPPRINPTLYDVSFFTVRAALQLLSFALCICLLYRAEGYDEAVVYWQVQCSVLLWFTTAVLSLSHPVSLFLPDLRPMMALAFPVAHLLGAVGLLKLLLHPSALSLFIQAVALYVVAGFGITCGAHRLWAHRSYKASWPMRAVLMCLNSVACQGDVYNWSIDHRIHHRYSEEPPDPHNAALGFWFSHCGWLMCREHILTDSVRSEIDTSDLEADWLVMLQHRLDPYLNLICSFLLPSIMAHYVYESFWLGFFVHGAFRWIMLLNATWCVNSVAHLWGTRPYTNIGPAESLFTAVVADGEGWHNYHHTFAFDYSTSEHGALVQWNPSKVVIDVAYHLGLVTERRRALKLWEKMKARRRARAMGLSDSLKEGDAADLTAEKREEDRSVWSVSEIISHCRRPNVLRSLATLGRDVLVSAIIMLVAYRVSVSPSVTALSILPRAALTIVYSIAQGTMWCSFWVVGYECAGGRFASVSALNHAVGCAVNTCLLVPYRPRRYEREYECARARVSVGVYEDIFAIVQPWEFFSWPVGVVVVAAFLTALTKWIQYSGWYTVALWYFSPYVVFNFWLITYYYILTTATQQKGPQQESSEESVRLNFLTMQRSMLATPFLFLSDHLHHHVRQMNMLQSIDLTVPHYHAKEALREVSKVLAGGKKSFSRTLGDARSTLRRRSMTLNECESDTDAIWQSVNSAAMFTQGLVDDTPAFVAAETEAAGKGYIIHGNNNNNNNGDNNNNSDDNNDNNDIVNNNSNNQNQMEGNNIALNAHEAMGEGVRMRAVR